MSWFGRISRFWRRSLQFRTVVLTILVTVAVVSVAGVVLAQRISSGLEEARIRSAQSEVAAAKSIARSAARGAPEGAGAQTVIDRLVAELSRRAGRPPAFEVVLEPQGTSGNPGGSTSLIDPQAIPPEFLEAMDQGRRQVWMRTPITYTDGHTENVILVGTPVNIRGIGGYDMYYAFSLSPVEGTVSLVTSAIVGVGIALVVALALLAGLFTRRLLTPVRRVARTADALAAGELNRRLPVEGEDDLAALAKAFNVMADSLSEQIVRLERLSDMQRRFVSDVSHELRTPLTTIRMAADLVEDRMPADDPEASRSAQLLLSEVDRFEELLADLLEISSFDAESADLDTEETDLVALVAELLGQLESLAHDHGSRIEFEVNRSQCLAQCESRRVNRILRNLVVNAIDYGAGHPVRVRLLCDDGLVEIRVRDFGPGLNPEDRERVFERFWRADPSRVRTLGGTGLGLAIAREDARLHGGSLSVEDADPGCDFVLRLPRDPTGGRRGSAAGMAVHSSSLSTDL